MSAVLTRRSSEKTGQVVALIVVLGVATGAAVVARPLVAIAAIVAMAWVVILLRHWGLAALASLVLVVVAPRYVYPVAGINVNLERLTLPILCAAMVMVLAIRPKTIPLRFGWPHLGLAFFIAANAIASILNAPSASDSLRLTLLIAIASLPFWILPSLGLNTRAMRIGFYIFVAIGTAEGLFGLLSLVLYQARGIDLGIQTDWLTGAPSPFGSMWEGNIFGSFVGAVFVAAFALLLSVGPQWNWRWLLRASVVCLAIALVASLSRGAWLGAFVGVGIVVVLAGGQRKRYLAGAGIAIAVIFIAAQLAFPASPVVTGAQHRLQTLSNPVGLQNDPTTAERLYAYGLAISDWRAQPLIGWGAGSLGQDYSALSQNIPVWVANLELHALHDSGVIGLAGLLVALIGVVVKVMQAIRRLRPGSIERGILVGLLAACVSLIIAFQATEATWLGYSWLLFGLAWTAASISTARRNKTR